jgi:hypothetical protein
VIRLLFTFVLAVSCFALEAQDTAVKMPSDTGFVKINKDPRVDKLESKYIESQNGKMKGYRVQIHFGAEKAKALQVKSRFLTKYPDMRAYDPFDAPYFKIRVGDFRTKLEAYKFLQEIKEEFPSSFIVTDEIELPEL